MGPRRAAALSLAAVAAALLLAAVAVVDARDVVLLRSGRTLAESPKSSKSAAASAAIQAALAKTKEVKERAAKVSASSSPRVKQCLDVCGKNFDSAVDSLNTAYDYVVNGHGSHDNLISKLSEAVTDVGTCDDAFTEEPGLVSPIADDFKKLTDLVSASLDKASQLR